jgi:iron complex outermembrane receptor protein
MKPQVGYHYEAGVRHAFHDAIEGNLTLFWADLRDEIFFNPETFSNENISKTRRRGVEAGLKVKPFSWITLWGNYAYIQPLLREHPFSGNDIPAVPRHKGSIGSDVDLGKGFLLNAKANLVGSRYLISDFRNRFDRLDPYCTLDLRLSYLWKGLRAFAGVNNLFNRKYSEYGVVGFMGNQSFYPSP